LEGRQLILFTQLEASALTLQRIYGQALDEFVVRRAITAKLREKYTLHLILLDLDGIEKTVTYTDRVGLDRTSHARCILRQNTIPSLESRSLFSAWGFLSRSTLTTLRHGGQE
jgi:hypothetical protein